MIVINDKCLRWSDLSQGECLPVTSMDTLPPSSGSCFMLHWASSSVTSMVSREWSLSLDDVRILYSAPVTIDVILSSIFDVVFLDWLSCPMPLVCWFTNTVLLRLWIKQQILFPTHILIHSRYWCEYRCALFVNIDLIFITQAKSADT